MSAAYATALKYIANQALALIQNAQVAIDYASVKQFARV